MTQQYIPRGATTFVLDVADYGEPVSAPHKGGKAHKIGLKAGQGTATIHTMTRQQRRAAARRSTTSSQDTP